MVHDDTAAAARVRGILEEAVAGGFRAETVEGASDEQIDAMAVAQGVRVVPAGLREVLRIMGRRGGAWLPGTTFGVTMVDAEGVMERRRMLAQRRARGRPDARREAYFRW